MKDIRRKISEWSNFWIKQQILGLNNLIFYLYPFIWQNPFYNSFDEDPEQPASEDYKCEVDQVFVDQVEILE